MVSTEFEARRRSIFSWGNLGKLGLTAAFFVWFYLIWTSTVELDKQLSSATDQFAVVHNLQVEYKLEVQEWKNLLLRSSDHDSLYKNWRTLEMQYKKVADAATAGLKSSDVRAINVKLQAFIEAHDANFAQYKKDAVLFEKRGYNSREADAEVKGIDRPVLEILEAADVEMEHEKALVNGRMIAKARNQIEQSLMALILMTLVVVWRAKF